MKMDFWRAAGVTAGAMVVSEIVWMALYPLWAVSTSLVVVKDIILTLVISAGFAWIYFQEVAPSARHGFYLGAFMVIVPMILSFILGIVEAMVGFSLQPAYPADMPEWYITFNLSLVVFVVLGATVMGGYLAKKK